MAMPSLELNRTGNIFRQPTGYDAFIPHKLCENDPNIQVDHKMIQLISEADRALGELIGVTKTIPDPDLFVAFYVRKEALLSSQIEGTQCSLEEVLQVDENVSEIKPVHEVVNYIGAMQYGLARLKDLPMSLRLIHEIHKELLRGVRGKEKTPGEYKRSQNWIGSPGCNLSEAFYVPPPPNMMIELMGDWEKYYYAVTKNTDLVNAAILHAHFETIHPYADGNGRLGRLLITFLLCEKKILQAPLLYLSLFFKEHRSDYYQLLMNVRFKGEWEDWLLFFLRGVRSVSNEAAMTANEIRQMHIRHRVLINEKLSRYKLAVPLYDLVCKSPIISITMAMKKLNIGYPTVKNAFSGLIELGILKPHRMETKEKLFAYQDYLEVLKRGTN